MDTLLPIQDRGGPAQPLLLATGLRKHFPVAGGLLGRTTKVVRAVDDLTLSVAKGETLSGLAKRYGVRLRTLAELNGLKTSSHLRQGQRLLIPDGASNPSSRSAAD